MTRVVAVIGLMVVTFALVCDGRTVSRNSSSGLHGTVIDIGSQGFQMSTADNKTLNVLVDGNTKFLQGGKPATRGALISGAKISVIGAVMGDHEMRAATVDILGAGKK